MFQTHNLYYLPNVNCAKEVFFKKKKKNAKLLKNIKKTFKKHFKKLLSFPNEELQVLKAQI